MDERTVEIPSAISSKFNEIKGKLCCIIFVSCDRSIRLGFGEPLIVESSVSKATHGESEIGTYGNTWRVLQHSRIFCASHDPVDNIQIYQEVLDKLIVGRKFLTLEPLSIMDFRIVLDDDIAVDILCAENGDDELLHIFFADGQVAVYTLEKGWIMGPADEPW